MSEDQKDLGADAAADVSAGQEISDAASHAAHTPGPWRVGGVNGNVVYGTEPEYKPSLVVAHCNHTGEVPPDVDRANAHLIAAAPDMYEALQAAINGPFSCPSVMVDQMRAALKKAEGK